MSAKILVVDDEADILQLSKDFFVHLGYDIVTASDGEEALTKAVSEKPDLIILDILMPARSGIDVCKLLRQNPRTSSIPIVISSVLEGADDRLKALDTGAIAFLPKPYNLAITATQIRNILEYRQIKMFEDFSDIELHTFMFHLLASIVEQTERILSSGGQSMLLYATASIGQQLIELYSKKWGMPKWTPDILGESMINVLNRCGGAATVFSTSTDGITIIVQKCPFDNNSGINGGRIVPLLENSLAAMACASGLADSMMVPEVKKRICRGDAHCEMFIKLGSSKER